MAPGRLLLGVGVGGDDRHEIEACGVDPATRGARTDESLHCIRELQRGEPVSYRGDHFRLDDVQIVPAVVPGTPVIVGGRSDRALDRAARHGDGWFGIFCSADRYAAGVQRVEAAAAELGRFPRWRHGMHVWCAVDPDPLAARRRLAAQMEDFYATPFDQFERYCPAGPAEHVAAFLADYVRAGARTITLAVAGPGRCRRRRGSRRPAVPGGRVPGLLTRTRTVTLAIAGADDVAVAGAAPSSNAWRQGSVLVSRCRR